MIQLSQADWQEIYYSVLDTLESTALNGSSRLCQQWRQHLNGILMEIGPDGETASQQGVEPNEP